jgi:hypothetical protein
MSYRICVTRTTGERETELEIHRGTLPAAGDEIDVELRSGRVKARVGSKHTEPSKAGGSVVIEVDADEI